MNSLKKKKARNTHLYFNGQTPARFLTGIFLEGFFQVPALAILISHCGMISLLYLHGSHSSQQTGTVPELEMERSSVYILQREDCGQRGRFILLQKRHSISLLQ